jgi:hypothetical protein
MSDLRPIVRRRDLGPRGMNLGSPRTIARWEEQGILPKRDLVLPGGEPAWYRDRLEAALSALRAPK